MYLLLGVDPEGFTCEHCGREGNGSLVVAEVNGVIVRWKSGCAAKVLGIRGGSTMVVRNARMMQRMLSFQAEHARDTLAYFGLPRKGEPTAGMFRHAVNVVLRENPELKEPANEVVRSMLARHQGILEMAEIFRK